MFMKIVFIVIFIYMFLYLLETLLSPSHGKLTLIMGKAGSGKSTKIAHIVKQNNKRNRPVYCNHHVLGANKIEPDWLGKYMLKDCTIIIDEAHICFDNRDFKSFTTTLKYFFSHFRHFEADVYIISQSWEDLDVKIRRQSQKMYIMQNSIIPFTICLQRVRMKFGVSEDGSDIVNQFTTSIIPIIGWVLNVNFTVWKYFDSYTIPDLPPVPYNTLWGNPPLKKTVKQTIYQVKKYCIYEYKQVSKAFKDTTLKGKWKRLNK